jgi:hypothetical protein
LKRSSEIDDLAQRIGASGLILPTYGRSEDFARPYIEVDDSGYHYVVVERGQEMERFKYSSDEAGKSLVENTRR